ncbi:DUF2690 domain-containing protein [Streptomyces ramulosus]|uniref:DUF2690 domain-containing protein n=1 Tax=Streptomyces TaxID=1883 RepID=UPI0031EA1AA3
MPRWRALPEELEPEIREFVRQLRGVVDRGGLSVSDVAERTGTPRADWVRYLDGRQPPPRAALAALARAAGVPAAHLAAMGEDAAAAWRRRAERGDGPPGAPGDGARAGRRRRAALAAGAGGALLLVAAAALLVRPGSSDAAPRTPASAQPAERSPLPPPGVRCTADGCMGHDPETSGCAAKAVTTARGTAGDVLIEVRYSADCEAAWARMVGADPGSQVSVSAHGHSARATAGRSGAATTPMVTVPGAPGTATACGTTARGAQGCAQPLATPVPVAPPGSGA